MDERLKPCPKCGGMNHLHRPVIRGSPKRPKWVVACEDCGFSGGVCNTPDDADKTWNKRAGGDCNG